MLSNGSIVCVCDLIGFLPRFLIDFVFLFRKNWCSTFKFAECFFHELRDQFFHLRTFDLLMDIEWNRRVKRNSINRNLPRYMPIDMRPKIIRMTTRTSPIRTLLWAVNLW